MDNKETAIALLRIAKELTSAADPWKGVGLALKELKAIDTDLKKLKPADVSDDDKKALLKKVNGLFDPFVQLSNEISRVRKGK